MDIFGFSIWFEPPTEVATVATGIIQRLSKEYNAPIFVPHVTLLSEITAPKDEIIDAMRKIGDKFPPITINLAEMGYMETYHHQLFVRVDLTEDLLKMNHYVYQLLKMEPKPYMPHLSLLYGNYPFEAKEKIMVELEELKSFQFTADKLHLNQSSGDESTWKVIYSTSLHGVAS